MSWYYEFDDDFEEDDYTLSEYTRPPEAIVLEGPIQATSKRGPIGVEWWGQQWVAAMEHLGRLGRRVYLDVPLVELDRRLGNLDKRGVIRDPGQDLAGLLAERRPLYERWSDLRVDCGNIDHDGVLDAVIDALESV